MLEPKDQEQAWWRPRSRMGCWWPVAPQLGNNTPGAPQQGIQYDARAGAREQPAKPARRTGEMRCPIPIKVRPEVLGGESSCTGKPYIDVR
jgi:hypothetical protein